MRQFAEPGHWPRGWPGEDEGEGEGEEAWLNERWRAYLKYRENPWRCHGVTHELKTHCPGLSNSTIVHQRSAFEINYVRVL